MGHYAIALHVNGETHHLLVEARQTLLETLRENLALTGTKQGCGHGVCGSCTVLRDGQPIRACLTLALMATDSQITTIEAEDAILESVKQCFVECGAVQCGFCMPGMVVAAVSLLRETPSPDRSQIRDGLAGHLCRCTGYVKIIEAVALAAQRVNEKQVAT